MDQLTPPVEQTSAFATVDTASAIVCVVVLLVLLGALWFWIPRLISFGQERGRDEERFVHETIAEFTGGPGPVLPPPTAEPRPIAPPMRPAEAPPGPGPQQPPPLPLPAAGGLSREEEALDRLAKRLTQLGVVEHFEGRMPLPIPPAGMIWRLRRGGSCLLLPRLEHQDTMEYLTRRFDMVFVLQGPEENVLVVERLASRVKDLLEMPSDRRA